MLRRPCIEPGCPVLAQGGARCPGHAKEREGAKNRRRAQLAPATGAAAQLRAQVKQAGGGTCANCSTWTTVQVDHRLPLADGGSDDWSNVQLLCVPCHAAKSAAEHRARMANRR